MVDITEIRNSNATFAAQDRSNFVCVFAGATAGIGAATLRELIGPTNKIVFVETQVALISGIDDACEKILAAEEKVDIVCVSPGGLPFQGAVYTDEGLESCFAVSYYSRLRLISKLLPLLHKSPHPRVLSILNGTKETKINERDIGLEESWVILAVINHTTLCTSLAFDHLATNDSQKLITFLHDTPGFVSTGTPRTARPSKANGLLWWALISFLQRVSGWIIRNFGMAVKESGERHAYLLTSDKYVPGSWRLNRKNKVVPDSHVLVYYRETGWEDKIWEFTNQVWERALLAARIRE